MISLAWVPGAGCVVGLVCCLLAGCSGGGSDESDDQREGSGGNPTQMEGTGGASEGTGGDVGESTGGSIAPTCDGPVIDLADPEGTEDAATRIAEGESWGFVRGMEGVGENLYIVNEDSLYVVEGDSTDRTLVSDQVPDLSATYLVAGRGRLRVDATHAYVATRAGISRIALSDGSVEELFVNPLEDRLTYALQLTDDLLYFGVSGDFIYSLPKAGGQDPTPITDQIGRSDFWVDGDYLYGPGQSDYVSRIPLAGGEIERVTSHSESSFQPNVSQVLVQDGKIYWGDGGVFLSCALDDCSEPQSHTVSHSDLFLVMGDRVYGTSGNLGWASLVDDECEILVKSADSTEVNGFAVTTNYVFFHGGFGGAVMRLPIE